MKRSFFKLLSGIIFFPIYLVSNLIPRSSKIWVFGAWFGNNYSDNPSYIYEYIINKKLPIDAIWLTNCNIIINDLRAKGFRVYHKFSIYGLWYGSRAGVTFINCGYDDVNKYCISGSLIVQLWHGIPLKKIKNDDLINEIINKNFFLWIKQIIEFGL